MNGTYTMHPIGRDTLNEPSMSLRKGAMRCVVIRLQPHRIWNSHSLADWIHTLISSPLLSLSLALSRSFFFLSSLFSHHPRVLSAFPIHLVASSKLYVYCHLLWHPELPFYNHGTISSSSQQKRHSCYV